MEYSNLELEKYIHETHDYINQLADENPGQGIAKSVW